MCRAFVLFNLKEKKDENMYAILLNYVSKSYEKNNRDGFFVVSDKIESLRTIDFREFVDYIIENEEKIKESRLILSHLRLATHGDHRWVHGWKIKNYYCCHNGVLNFRKIREFENDSYTFFYHVLNSNVKSLDDIIKNIKNLLKKSSGSGVMFMTDLKKHLIIISFNKQATFHLINNSIITITSQDDIHEDMKEKIKFVTKKYKLFDFGEIQFEEEIEDKNEVKVNLKIEKDLTTTVEDEIVVFDIEKKKFVKRVDIEKFDRYYNNYYYRGII